MDARVQDAILHSEYRSFRNRQRRIKQLKRRCFLFVFTIVLVLGMAVSYNAILSEATIDNSDTVFKYYTSIEVTYGESLWSIAEEYVGEQYASAADYIHEVMEINHLQEETLSAGQYLIVPYFSYEMK